MKRQWVWGVVCVGILGVGGCGQATAQHEAIAVEMVKVLEELASTLESVKDVPSAKASVARLDALTQKIDELHRREKSLSRLRQSEADRILAKHRQTIAALNKRLEGAALKAGFSSRGEPSMVAALERLDQAVKRTAKTN